MKIQEVGKKRRNQLKEATEKPRKVWGLGSQVKKLCQERRNDPLGSKLLMGNDYFILNQGVNRDKCPWTLPRLATVVFLIMTQPYHQGRGYSDGLCPLSSEPDLNLVP